MSEPQQPERTESNISGSSPSYSGGGSLHVTGAAVASYTPNANTVVVGSTVISRRPDEELALLSKVECQVLLDGDIGGAKAGRDLFSGFLISGLIGLIGLLATAHWHDVFTNGNWGTAVWAAVMFAVVFGSLVGVAINALRLKKVSRDSAYSNLINRLKKHIGINE